MTGDYRALFDEWVEQARKSLGIEAFSKSWQEGRDMPVDDLISLA